MRRYVFAYGLLLVLLVQVLGASWLYVWYQLDRTSFAEAWCENLEQPQLDCWGQCVIDDLQQTFEANTPADMPQVSNQVHSLLAANWLPSHSDWSLAISTDQAAARFHYLAPYTTGALSPILRPPRA